MADVMVEQDVEGNFHVTLQLTKHANSSRVALLPSVAMEMAADLIRASLDARFRNANTHFERSVGESNSTKEGLI